MQHFASGKRYAAGCLACSRRKTTHESVSVSVPNDSSLMPVSPGKTGLFKRSIRIMKLTAFLLTLGFLQVQANGLGQEVTLDVKEEKLEKVIPLIEKQTGYVFFYTSDLIKKARPVTLQVRNEALSKVLDLCFKNQALDYAIDGKTISLIERRTAISQTSSPSSPIEPFKKVTVLGRVVNEKDEPVAGATVMVKGSTYATATDERGEFRLEEVEETSTLIISGANIETSEVKIRGRESVSIKVQSKIAVNEAVVVVSTGYQDIPKERVTGSFTQPNKEMYNTRVSTDIISKLEGITSGLVFNKNPSNGATELNIRGRSTIFANSEPLIVVDNFPYSGDINNINPNDVETVTVLKDAAASSIWGVRAGNGVIVITTKKGKFNQPLKVQVNTNITISEKPNLFYDPNFLTSGTFIEAEQLLFELGYYNADLSNTVTFPAVSPVIEILSKVRNGVLPYSEGISQINQLKQNDVRSELLKYFYRNPLTQQYNISLSGGSDKINSIFSVGYDNKLTEFIKGNNYRLTINSLNTFTPIKNLEISLGFNYTQNENLTGLNLSEINTTNSKRIYPYAKFADDQGNYLPIVKNFRDSFVSTVESKGLLNWQYIPLHEKDLNSRKRKSSDTRLITGIKYQIYRNLFAEATFQYQKGTTQENSFRDSKSYYVRNLINRYATINSSGVVTKLDNIPLGGILETSSFNFTSKQFRSQLSYSNKKQLHNITALTGIEVIEVLRESNNNTLYGYNNELGISQLVNPVTEFTLYPTNTSATIPVNISSGSTLDRFRSYYANGAYSYDNRYVLSLSGRIDQSNFFGVKANQRSVPLWSWGIKWNLSNELFYKINWLPNLNLRVTYGFNGNLDKSVTAYATAVYLSSPIPPNFAQFNNVPNPNLRWEKTGILNIGFDFGSKNNILSGSIDYFNKKGIDLMGDAVLAPSIGYVSLLGSNSARGNFADMKGQGIDITINTKNLSKTIQWNTSFLLSYATDKVTKYDINYDASTFLGADVGILPLVGKPIYGLFSFRWGGLDPLTGNPRGYLADTLSTNYSAIRGQLEFHDIVYHGPTRPILFGGLNNIIKWQRLTLSANISYKLGYFFRRRSINYGSFINNLIGHKDFTQRWQKKGDEAVTTVPSFPLFVDTDRDNFYAQSEILVEKGDHIRLQDISLSYELEKKQLPKLPINHVQFYLYINNIGILWRANNQRLDPDFYSGGILPARSLSFGVKASF